MKRWIRLAEAGLLALLWLLSASAVAQSQFVPNPKLLNSELLARGKTVYKSHCAGCHGEKGDGIGPGAYGLHPKPRDFTTGMFKFRTTPGGYLPTDEDLVRTVRQGIAGTSMPAFDLMPEREVLAVVQYLKVFSEKWKDPSAYTVPVAIAHPPEWFQSEGEFQSRARLGQELFQTACVPCHGIDADGRGVSAASLVDFWGQPVQPADLRKPVIRSGRNITDIYKVLATGIDGTPMPSFKEAFSEDQLWELIAFVQQKRWEKNGRPHVVALRSDATVQPVDPSTKPAAAEPASIYE